MIEVNELSAEVAKIMGWDSELDNWMLASDELPEPPPYAEAEQWVLFNEMVEYLSSKKLHWEIFTTDLEHFKYGMSLWRESDRIECWGNSMNEVIAQCVAKSSEQCRE